MNNRTERPSLSHFSRTRSYVCWLTSALFIGVQLAVAQPAQPLTNEDVVKLSALGLGDEVVVAKIKQAPEVAFSLEIAGIEKLTKDGVSKGIITAMLQRTTKTPAATASVVSASDVWVVVNEKQIELPSVSGYVEESIGQAFKQVFLFSLKNKMAITARGTKAATRFAIPPTIIYTRYKPSDIGVVRLTVQPKKERRYIWVVSRVGSNAGEFFPPEDDMKFTDERAPDGTFKLTLKAPLAPGEYALIAAGGMTGYSVHEFAVDGK